MMPENSSGIPARVVAVHKERYALVFFSVVIIHQDVLGECSFRRGNLFR